MGTVLDSVKDLLTTKKKKEEVLAMSKDLVKNTCIDVWFMIYDAYTEGMYTEDSELNKIVFLINDMLDKVISELEDNNKNFNMLAMELLNDSEWFSTLETKDVPEEEFKKFMLQITDGDRESLVNNVVKYYGLNK